MRISFKTIVLLFLFPFTVHAVEECVAGKKSVSINQILTEHTVLYPLPKICKPLLVEGFSAIKAYEDPEQPPETTVDYSLSWSKQDHDLWHVVQYEVRINGNTISTYDYGESLPVEINLAIPSVNEGLASFEIRACASLDNAEFTCGDWQSTETQCDISCIDNSYTVPQLSSLSEINITGDFQVNWSASNHPNYELQQSINGGDWVSVYVGGELSFLFENQRNNEYAYKVRVVNGNIYSDFSEVEQLNVQLEIPIFGALEAESTTGDYSVSWSAVSYDEYVVKYQLQEKINDGEWHTVSSDKNYNEEFVGQALGFNYAYQIRACRTDDNCSDYSDPISIDVAVISVESIDVYEDLLTGRRYITWDFTQDIGTSGPQVAYFKIVAYNGPTVIDTYFSSINDPYHKAIDSLDADRYTVEACSDSFCSSSKSDDVFDQGLTSPHEFSHSWDTTNPENIQIQFSYQYDEGTFGSNPGGRPQYFQVMSTFPQADNTFEIYREDITPIDNHEDQWSTGNLNRSDVVGTTFAVVACSNELGCSTPTTIAVGEPVIDEELPVPEWTDISYDNTSNVMSLNWRFNTNDKIDEIDYILITEKKPKISDNQTILAVMNEDQIPEMEFYSHQIQGPMKLNRLGKGYYDYDIQACKRNDEGPDGCSDKAESFALNSSQSVHDVTVWRDDVTTANLLKPTDIGWVLNPDDNSQIDQLYWSYDETVIGAVIPDYFMLTANPDIASAANCMSKRWALRADGSNYDLVEEIIHGVKYDYADIVNGSQWSSFVYCSHLNSGSTGFELKACKNGVGCSDAEYIDFSGVPTTVSPPDITGFELSAQQDILNSGGDPSLFNPGHWWHPDLGGSGWNFFWVNGLRQTANHGYYGETYDLVGYWISYKMVGTVWTPTWFEVRLKYVQDTAADEKLYQGDIMYHERVLINGEFTTNTIDTGNMKLRFNVNSGAKATMALNIDYSKGLFNQIDVAENIKPYRKCAGDAGICTGFETGNVFLEIDDFSVTGIDTTNNGPNNADHYMGLWQTGLDNPYEPLSTADMSIVTWIDGGVETNHYLYFDASGVPVWVQSAVVCYDDNDSCLRPRASYFEDFDPQDNIPGNFTVKTIADGFNPLGQVPPAGVESLIGVGKAGRVFEVYGSNDYNFRDGRFWLEINNQVLDTGNGTSRDINTNGSFGSGEFNTVSMEKRANLHGIEFKFNEFNGSQHVCDLNIYPACNVFLSWYTDDHFGANINQQPEVEPYFIDVDTNQLSPLSNLCDEPIPAERYAMKNFRCTFNAPYNAGGNFKFQFRKKTYGTDDSYFPIAESETLTIIPCSTTGGCTNTFIQPSEELDPTIVDSSSLMTHVPGDGPIPGSGSTSGGTATYQLPVAIPPGRNGMTPDLSINYSSKSGSGVMGIGWSVSAGSAISRCPQTKAQDGITHAVDFSNNDRLCLDGQRLMNTSVLNYWDNNATYRTEIDSFARVTKVSISEFKVQTKSGRTITYEQMGTDQKSIWQITKELDSFGNSITYQYTEFGHNESLLTDIVYTGKGTDLGSRRIKFIYQDRLTDAESLAGRDPRYDVSYNYGEKSEQTRLLTELQTYTSVFEMNRSYRFSYRSSKSNDDLLIEQITENANGVERILIDLNWSDNEWSDSQWMDQAASKYEYTNINSSANETIIGSGFSALLGRAKITNDYNGDGIKEYLSVSASGENRSLLFFDDQNILKLKLDLPTTANDEYISRVFGSSDLTLNGYTDLIDSEGIYSWKKEQLLPEVFSINNNNMSTYFDVSPLPFSRPSGLYNSVINGESVVVDENKNQYYLYDYNRDGLQDVLEYVTPRIFNPHTINLCYPFDDPNDPGVNCSIDYAKILIHLNTTHCTTNSCTVEFDEGKVIIDDLNPYVDLEREGTIWMYFWDDIVDIDDYNGDGFPDVHITSWAKNSITQEYDSTISGQNDRIYFTNSNTINGIPAPWKSLKDLGLQNFQCQKYDAQNNVIDVSCNVISDSVNDYKAYHFTDINGDGLKDFIYYDRGSQFLKSWKVRLNQGGDPFSTNNNENQLFVLDFISDVNDPANTYSLDQPGGNGSAAECATDINGNYSSPSYARKCNPFFRASSEMKDIDSDGTPELLISDWDVSDVNSDSKPDNMIFNYCSIFNLKGSSYIRRNTQPNTESATLPIYEEYTVSNIIPRYSGTGANEADLVTELLHDPALNASAFYPYTEETQPDYEVNDAFREFLGDLFEEDPDMLTPVTPEWACSYNSNDNITLTDGYIPKDMYEDFGSMAALSDRGLYRQNAIKFELSPNGHLKLTLSKETGIYRPLFEGSVGDLSGNGISDTLSTVGCLFGTQFCTSIIDDLFNGSAIDVGQWNVNANILKNYGAPIVGMNKAEMPNMLTSVTKPSTGEWVSWDYHPISAKINRFPNSSLPLYTLPERGDALENGYINEANGIGSHIFFNSSMYVVSEMRQSNGLKNDFGDQYNTIQYGYKEAVYNLQGRGFQGFREITTDYLPMVDSELNKTRSISTFHQVFPLAGKLEWVENYQTVNNELKRIQRTDYSWYKNQNFSNSGNAQVIYHPVESIITHSWDYDENGNDELLAVQSQWFDENYCSNVTTAYDDYGNSLCSRSSTTETLLVKDKSGNKLADKTLVTTVENVKATEYYTAEVTGGKWWVDKLKSTTAETGINEAGSFDKPYGSSSGLSRNVKSLLFWSDDRKLTCQFTLPGSTILPTDCEGDITDTSISRNAFEYDEWGNIIKVTSSGKTSNLPIGETQNRITKSEFRGTGGYFANQIIKELGIQEYTTYIKYDNATGQVLSTTNPSGVKTVNDYDEFGFPKSAHTFVAVDPNDQLEAPSGAAMKNCGLGCSSQKALLNNLINAIKPHIPSNTGFFFQSNSSIPEITFKADNKQSGSPRVTTWLDQNGNAVLTKTQHSGGQAYVLTLTNPLGQVELITEPFAVSGNNYLNDYSDPNITRDYPYFTFNLYDERGRMREKLVEVGQLNGDGDNCKRNTVYEHFRNNTKVTAGFSGDNCQSVDQDNNNLEMYRTYDLQGKIRQTVDAKEFITKYWYDSSGNPHYITDAANNHIITHYDDLSRKTAVQDPNMGTKTFLYNSFGEVVFQRDAVQAEYSGYIANYSLYDQWGRVTNQYINSQYIGGVFEPVAGIRAYFDSYDYSSGCSTGNNTLCGRFRLSSYNSYTEEDSDGFYAAQEIEYQYDAFGRVISEATEMPGVLGEYGIDNLLTDPSLTTQYYYYENHNLLKQTIHNNIRGNGLSVVNHYDAYGSLTKQVENPSGNELMRVVDWDLRGQPLAKVLNDNSNMMTEYSYYPGSGQTKSINNSHSGGLQSFDYSYDAWGNIYSQKLNNNIIETFKYDELQRLKESKIGHAAISFEYDDTIGLGNLISKSDYSMNQVYDQNGKPNAIISAALNSGGVLHYEYDFNGNRIKDSLTGSPDSGIKANYQYDAANLLIASQRPAESQYVSYRYGIGNQRFAKHEETYDEHGVARGEITLYVGSQFEQVINTITHEIETKFQLTDYLTITLDNLSNQVRNFTQKDRLGSTTQILNASGIQVATKGYDAFGKPRNGDNWSQLIKPTLDFKNPDLTANSIDITKRGFTNHEHLDAFELIHMNGRMYDFNNGRFLSVDPFIQGTTSQAINPYSYIDNNPLSGTDPTGYRKSICGQDGMRKCDTIIGPHSRKGVWNGFANTNGKVIGVIVFTGDNDDTSGIWSLNDRGEFNKENSDYLNGKKLLFFNAIERMMYILAYDSGSLNLLAQSDADARFNPEIAQYVPKRYNPDRDINDLFEMLSVADQAFRGYFENIDQNSLEFAKGYRDGVISVPVSILKLYATLPHIWSDEGIIARRVIDHELNSYILIPEYRKEVNHYINYGIKIAISRMSDEQLSYYAGRYLGRDHTIDLLNRNVSSAPGLGEFYYGIHSAAEGLAAMPARILLGTKLE